MRETKPMMHRSARAVRWMLMTAVFSFARAGIGREAKLARHRPLRPSFDQHLMPHHMHEIHPEHPPSEPQIPRSGKSAISPQVAYSLSGAPR